MAEIQLTLKSDAIAKEILKEWAGKPIRSEDLISIVYDTSKRAFDAGMLSYMESYQKHVTPSIRIEEKSCEGKYCPGGDGCWGGKCMHPEIKPA